MTYGHKLWAESVCSEPTSFSRLPSDGTLTFDLVPGPPLLRLTPLSSEPVSGSSGPDPFGRVQMVQMGRFRLMKDRQGLTDLRSEPGI